MPLDLSTSVQYIKGVGPARARSLAGKNIQTVEDLLYHLPFRYEDRLNPRTIAELRPGEMASLIAEVRGAAYFRTRRAPLLQVTFGQGRHSLKAIWFHAAYLKDRFRAGMLVALYGKVEASTFGRGGLEIRQPQFEILGTPEPGDIEAEAKMAQSLEIGRIVPIYESADHQTLTSRWFRGTLWHTLQELKTPLPDGIPRAIRERQGLMDRFEAFQRAHFPPPGESFADLQDQSTAAHRRLIFEELFFLEVGLGLKRARMKGRPGIAMAADERVRAALKRVLPFHPTAAQKRVLKEIAGDMAEASPMRRLLQGDVGSGKTLVALEAAVLAVENGYQAALMAPTEILATQHYLSARRLLEPLGYRIVLLTGSLDPAQKRELRRHITQGHAQVVIGTHALIEEKVEFARIGLVIVDEQHRFGVMQRFRLMKKTGAAEPHMLVMTATPIPRTLALTLYGDLDVSVLDEMPPGRTPVVTRRVGDERAADVWEFLRKQVQAGRQAYVVYPVIEAAEEEGLPGAATEELASPGKGRSKLGLKAAISMYDELRTKVLPDLRIGLLHGRLPAEEKDAVMQRFQRRELDVLVSTTVIEVGVDVANANLMVIEHAERFGLSQLHQLRGRIGRGAAQSYCVLMTGGQVSPEAERRLSALVRTQNGFEIAELDLELRGPGEFFGTRQAGMPAFRVANLLRDRQMLELARREAVIVVAGKDPAISRQEAAAVMDHLKAHWQRRYGLVEAG